MSPRASVTAWQRLASAAWVGWAAKGLLGSLCVLIAAQYLGGYLFLWWIRSDPKTATPLTIARYGHYYGARIDVRRKLWASSTVGLLLICVPVAIALVPRKPSLHGDARFATTREIAEAGLFADEGIVLGRTGGWGPFGGRFLILGGQVGAMLTAQPRSGKGVGVVVPTLLSYSHSIVCTDIKKENWTVTAGFRRSLGHEVHLFDPLSPRTSRWNLLDYVDAEYGKRINDIQLIANMFIPDAPGTDPFWSSGARTMFLGIALYLFSTPSLPCTVGEILRQGMANNEEGFSAHWKRVMSGRQSGRNPLPDVCVRSLSDVIDLAPQTLSSIRKTFTGRLELWLNPILDAATAASDFDLRDLRKRPMSIYVSVMPPDLKRLAPLMSLFFQQAIALHSKTLPEHDPTLKNQVLMLMDEFPSLGHLPIVADSAGFLPGFDVRLLTIQQSESQVRNIYGPEGAKTLRKTLAARVHFAPKEMDDAKEISEELGYTTVKVKTISRPTFSLFGRGSRQGSVSISEQKRALMLPQEIKEMGSRREIILAENVRPIFCRQIRYYLMPVFLARLRLPPALPKVEPIVPASISATDGPPQAAPKAKAGRARGEVSDNAFDKVVVPQKAEGELLTQEELDTAVNQFLEALRER